MSATQLQQTGRVGLLGSEAGNAVDGFAALFLGDDLGDIALDTEDLADMEKIQVIIEYCL